jgi:DNA-binding transcriptional LysR family regulator
LFQQFFTPRHNKREDDYGGPVENRMRLLMETARLIGSELPDFPMMVRLSATEYVDGGYSLDDIVTLSKGRVVCASPAYLRDKGNPRHPDDLAHHECILIRFGQTIDRDWPFLIDGEARRIVVRGHRIANDGGLIRDWCRNGYGIARKSLWDVEADLKAGTLVELLQEFSAGSTGLQIVYPATQDQPKRVRLLIERLAEAFSSSAASASATV